MKIIATILTALAVVSCENITPEQVDKVHDIYHVLTGAECIFIVPEK